MKPTYNFLIILTLMLLSNISYSQSVPSYVPTNGLVGWWGFNGNAQDGSGNGNHGTVNGAALTTDRHSNANSAFLFDGSNSWISIPHNSHFNFGNFKSISVWIYKLGISNLSCCASEIISKNRDSNLNSFTLRVHHGQGQPVTYNSFNLGGVSSLSIINDSQWYHLVITVENGEKKIFVNGVLESTNNSPNWNIGTNSSPILIGKQVGDGNPLHYYLWNGKIDDIGIWNRALTPQEITNLYNSQLPTQTSLCLPTITTSSPSSAGVDTVVIGGDISNDGGSSIVLRGVCYSTSPNPNMGNQRTEDGSGIGSFNTVLRGLTSSTTYYARSYSKNSNGVVVYGNEVSFTTSAPLPGVRCPGTPTVTDIDGNIYNTVQIGNQCWTQSNLKVSKYRNGDSIPTGLNNSQWNSTTSGAYAIYNNDPVNDGLYGKLYNHYAVTDSRGLCPTGWHVPSDGEWNVMVKYLDPNADTVCGGCWQSNIAGGALKSTAMQPTPGGWNPPNTGATNSSGFTALPGGFRNDDGDFTNMPNNGCWWSSSVLFGSLAWYRTLFETNSFIPRHPNTPTHGVSVRCLKD